MFYWILYRWLNCHIINHSSNSRNVSQLRTDEMVANFLLSIKTFIKDSFRPLQKEKWGKNNPFSCHTQHQVLVWSDHRTPREKNKLMHIYGPLKMQYKNSLSCTWKINHIKCVVPFFFVCFIVCMRKNCMQKLLMCL